MQNEITNFDRLTIELDPTGAIETHIWDDLMSCKWSEVSDILSQLESASCSAGSWSDMIYTRDILDKLADSQWVSDIDEAIAEYVDATGETPTFDPYGSGFELSHTVTFAVDWVAHRLADKLRNLGRVAVVTAASDSLDPFPDRIAFPSESEAVDWVADEVQRRLDHRVSHSPYPVSDEDLQHWEAEEMTLIQIDVERL
jgi:hypothetical protein